MKKPNIIFVLTDDQGYGDLGCTGNEIIKTPRIDEFSQKSINFTNFHVGPTCAPTRAGLLTGHYANSTGVWHTIGGRSLLRENEWTLADALKENGYKTGIFGKWHLGDNYPYRPQDRGFDNCVIHGGGGIGQVADYWGNDYFDDTYLVNGSEKRFSGYCTDVWFEQATRFISENKENPFFCYIPVNAPHKPLNVETKYKDLYKGKVSEEMACFYGMITCIDENFGKLLKTIQDLNLDNNTIVIFMTDNGTCAGAIADKDGFNIEGYNAGFRGVKGSPYDGGHRVPFFLKIPESVSENKNIKINPYKIDTLAANIDFMPTLLELCEISYDKEKKFHGSSLMPLINGDKSILSSRAIVTDSQRVTNPIKWKDSSVCWKNWRLVNKDELYNMEEDIEQRENLFDKYPDIVEYMKTEYEKWWKLVSTQFSEEIPISIGSENEPETCLTSMDWRNEDCSCPWNQSHIRQGQIANGYWEINVLKSGFYNIELRRWPKESKHLVTQGLTGEDIEWEKEYIQEKNHEIYSGGKALNILEAKLIIEDKIYKEEINEKNISASFEVYIERGQKHLLTKFSGENGLILGAYYVYIQFVKAASR